MPYAIIARREKRNLHFTALDDSAESCEDGGWKAYLSLADTEDTEHRALGRVLVNI